jgi:hypothetical protein
VPRPGETLTDIGRTYNVSHSTFSTRRGAVMGYAQSRDSILRKDWRWRGLGVALALTLGHPAPRGQTLARNATLTPGALLGRPA